MEISVVIPSYQMAAGLAQSLRFLAGQRCDVRFEVVVSDDGSADDTRAVVQSFQDRLNLVYVHRARDSGSGRARARNLGIAASHGAAVTFLDAGVLVPADFVATTWAAIGAGTGRALVHEVLGQDAEGPLAVEQLDADRLHGAIDRLGDDEEWIDYRRGLWAAVDRDLSRLPAPWSLGWTCGLTVSRTDATAIDGFDVAFVGWGAEDLDFCYRLHRRGVRFAVPERAVAVHLPHPRRPSQERRGTDFENRLRLHRRDHLLETEIAVVYGALHCNVIAQRFDLMSLERAMPYRSRSVWQQIAGTIGSVDRLCIVGLDRAETARTVGAVHAFVPSRAAARDLQTRLPEVTVEASLGCFTRHADLAFGAALVTDGIRLFPEDHQAHMIRESCRIARQSWLVLSQRDDTPFHPFRSRYRAAAGWPWSLADDIVELAHRLGKRAHLAGSWNEWALFQLMDR